MSDANAPEQPTLPNTETPEAKPDQSAELAAKLKAAEDKAAKLEAAEKKRKADTAKASAEAAADKAIEDGKAKAEIERLNAEAAAAAEKAGELEAAMTARIDKQIEALSDDAKAEVAAIREHLPLSKLAEFVEAKAATASPATPAAPPSFTPGAPQVKGKRKLHADTYDKLDQLMVDPTHAESLQVEVDPVLKTSRFVMPIPTLIKNLHARTVLPTKLNADNADKRKG